MASDSVENHPKRWKWRLEWLAHTCVEKIAGMMPGPLVFRLGERAGALAWRCLPTRRKVVFRNLRIAFHGEHDLAALEKMTRETFRRIGGNLLSTVHTTRLSGARIDSVLTVENQEVIEKSMSGNAGLVLMPPHMGNWEILSRMNRLFPQGHKIGAFYRPLTNPILNARVEAQRATDGTRLFSKWDSLHQVTGFLREGGLIGILADQRVGKQGELVRFFGRLTRASPLPSLMARRSRSEVLTLSLITDTPGKWRVRYHLVERPFTTTNCMEALERAMKVSPPDVFWLQERWKVQVHHRQTICEWLGPDSLGTGKPHRALLWLPSAPDGWEIPEGWKHPDVIYEVVLAPGQANPPWLKHHAIVHTASSSNTPKALRKALTDIDMTAALPVDYILAHDAPAALRTAARRETIPLVSLASGKRKMSESRQPAGGIS